ncbi:MAG: hypothetical protein KGL55_05295, partial [Rhodospirillales bacterium]|nr:hypothetical protein [Rhodospirillales bacterium]
MTVPPGQAATAALLERLAGAAPIETHISAVFRGADTVWKLRKAVRLSFLDFSSLAGRERAARRELALNAPHAPGLYRDVVAVARRADGTLALGEDGEVVDWVVRMARVPESDFLDAIAARGGLDAALLDAVADSVAAYHAALAPAAQDTPAMMGAVIAGNATAARAAGLDPAPVRRWLAGAQA